MHTYIPTPYIPIHYLCASVFAVVEEEEEEEEEAGEGCISLKWVYTRSRAAAAAGGDQCSRQRITACHPREPSTRARRRVGGGGRRRREKSAKWFSSEKEEEEEEVASLRAAYELVKRR